jgi:hypothetical protein
VRAVFDDHEQRLPDDVESLAAAWRSRSHGSHDSDLYFGDGLRLFQTGQSRQ